MLQQPSLNKLQNTSKQIPLKYTGVKILGCRETQVTQYFATLTTRTNKFCAQFYELIIPHENFHNGTP